MTKNFPVTKVEIDIPEGSINGETETTIMLSELRNP